MVLAITNGSHAAAENGVLVGAVVSILCQTGVKKAALMVLVGGSTSLIPVFLAPKVLPTLGNQVGEERQAILNRIRWIGFAIHLIDTVVFILAARALGVFGTNGSILYGIAGTINAAKCFFYIDPARVSGSGSD